MAQILTGTKVPNADKYTIKYRTSDSIENDDNVVLRIKEISQPGEGEDNFYFNLTDTKISGNASNGYTQSDGGSPAKNLLIPGKEYAISCIAHAADNSIWTDSLEGKCGVLTLPSIKVELKYIGNISEGKTEANYSLRYLLNNSDNEIENTTAFPEATEDDKTDEVSLPVTLVCTNKKRLYIQPIYEGSALSLSKFIIKEGSLWQKNENFIYLDLRGNLNVNQSLDIPYDL